MRWGIVVAVAVAVMGLLWACGGTQEIWTTAPCGVDASAESGRLTWIPRVPISWPNDAKADGADSATDAGDGDGGAAGDVDIDALFNVFPEQGNGGQYYFGGPILDYDVPVYFLWYGDWTSSPAPEILEDMLHGLSGDGYHGPAVYSTLVSLYYGYADGGPEAGLVWPTGRFLFKGSYYLGYPAGTYLGLGNDENMVANAITYSTVPYDPTAAYVIMTSPDVEQDLGPGSGFCQTYCAYHQSGVTNDLAHRPFHYVFVGNPMRCPDLCTMRPQYLQAGAAFSPNDDWAADGMSTLMIHELYETIVDPLPHSGWANPFNQAEIGDVCAWRFEPVFKTDAGSYANVHWGDRDYLIQQLWFQDTTGGRCAVY